LKDQYPPQSKQEKGSERLSFSLYYTAIGEVFIPENDHTLIRTAIANLYTFNFQQAIFHPPRI
jgi:hypothetical protein